MFDTNRSLRVHAVGFWIFVILSVCLLPTKGSSESVTLKINNADVTEVLKTICDQSDLDLAIAAGIKNTITIHVDSIESRTAIEIIAELAGLAYAIEDGVLKIMTPQQYTERFGSQPFDKRRLQSFDLRHIDPASILSELNKLKSAKGLILVDELSNQIHVLDTRPVLELMRDVLKVADRERILRAYNLRFVSPGSLEQTLGKLLTPSSSIIKDEANNRLIVIDRPERIDRLDSLVRQVDVPGALISTSVRLQYAEVGSVLPHVEGLLTPNAGSVRADIPTNQLIVVDLPWVIDQVIEVVRSLDVKTREVFIEAKIVQVGLTKALKTGVNWQAVSDEITGGEVRGDFNILSGSDQGLRITGGILDETDYEAILEALSESGETDLLSEPHIAAIEGKEASIHVGSSIPYKTVDTREEDGAIRTFERVTMVKVGVKLSVVPTTNDSGYVRMLIKPEVSSVTGFSDGIPVVEETTAETEVIVRDGVTLIIGGLIKKEDRKTVKKVPLLGDIPLIGRLFSSNSSEDVKSELIIFITPHIISGDVTQPRPGSHP